MRAISLNMYPAVGTSSGEVALVTSDLSIVAPQQVRCLTGETDLHAGSGYLRGNQSRVDAHVRYVMDRVRRERARDRSALRAPALTLGFAHRREWLLLASFLSIGAAE